MKTTVRLGLMLGLLFSVFGWSLSESSCLRETLNGYTRVDVEQAQGLLSAFQSAYPGVSPADGPRASLNRPVRYDSSRWPAEDSLLRAHLPEELQWALSQWERRHIAKVLARVAFVQETLERANQSQVESHLFQGETEIRSLLLQPLIEKHSDPARSKQAKRVDRSFFAGLSGVALAGMGVVGTMAVLPESASSYLETQLENYLLPVMLSAIALPAAVAAVVGCYWDPQTPHSNMVAIARSIGKLLDKGNPSGFYYWGGSEADASGQITSLVDVTYFVDPMENRPMVLVTHNRDKTAISEVRFEGRVGE